MKRAREIPCPSNNEECKYAPNCHLSRHHIYKRRLGTTALARRFINDPRNVPNVCRDIHDKLDDWPPYVLPSKEVMLEFTDEP